MSKAEKVLSGLQAFVCIILLLIVSLVYFVFVAALCALKCLYDTVSYYVEKWFC